MWNVQLFHASLYILCVLHALAVWCRIFSECLSSYTDCIGTPVAFILPFLFQSASAIRKPAWKHKFWLYYSTWLLKRVKPPLTLSRRTTYIQVCFVCCVRSIRSTPSQLHSLQQISTQHDMLPQHLLYKNELNREYVITLARNDETPWWWSEEIETCRSGFKCSKVF